MKLLLNWNTVNVIQLFLHINMSIYISDHIAYWLYRLSEMTPTRSRTEIFLIVKTIGDISSHVLPTNKQILQFFYHSRNQDPRKSERDIVCCRLSQKRNLSCSSDCLCVMKKVVSIYNRAGIPIIRLDHVREKILKLIQTHKNIIKLKNRTSPTE